MKKNILSKLSFTVLLLLVFQLFFPIANLFAESNNNILPPSNLAAQQLTPDDVKLTWSAVYGATGYNVYEIRDGQIILLGKAGSTSYTLNNLMEGSYQYVVSTLSTEGESGPSAPVSVDIIYPEMMAPGGITHTIKNGNDIVLSWDASQYAESYNVYQLSLDGEKVLLTSVTTRTYTISNASEDQFTYSVSAVNSLYGESLLSNSTQIDVVYPVMTSPENFTYTVTNGTDVTLKWNSVPFATNYKIYQIIDEQKTLINTVTGTTALKLVNVPAGDYVYEVHSYSERFGESATGSQLTLTVGSIIMTAPVNFTFKVQNTNDIVLSWESVPFASSYKVYQIIDGQPVLKSTVTGTTITYSKVAGGDYIFEVHSYSDRYGESEQGSQVFLTVETVAMTAPSNFAYTIKNGNDINLSWSSVADATGYKVYQIVNGQKVLKSTITGTTITYINMPEGEYRYEVHSNSTRFGESTEGSQLTLILTHPEMQPPTNLIQTINNATDFTLSWDASLYTSSYKVYQMVDGQKVLKSSVTGTNITYTKMPPGTYTFVVYSYSSRFGESSVGTQLTFTLNGQVMEAPTNLTYSITNGNDLTLKWTAAEYATSYKIYQIIEGQKVLKSTVKGTVVTYTNLPGDDYHFVIHSISSLLGESPNGEEITISVVLPIMEAPENPSYRIQNGSDVILTWSSVQYANSYKVYEIIDGQKILKNTVSSLSTLIPKVSAGEHTYVVHSVSNRFGESLVGSEVDVVINEHMMKAPENLNYTINNGNDVTLRWDAVTYATAYNIYQIIDGERILEKTVSGRTVTFTNLAEGEYQFVVHSYSSDRFGESPEGSEVSFTVIFPVMQSPENLTNTITNGNDIILKWNPTDYATAYNIYQIIDGQKEWIKTVSGTSVLFSNMPEGAYNYEVHSVSTRFGESVEGSSLNLTLTWPIMQAPENLTNTITNGNDIILRWNAADYATSYNLYQIIDGQKEWIKTVSGTSVLFSNIPEGAYKYEVHSSSTRFGESTEGSIVNFTLTWPVVQPPELTGDIFNVNNITLSWNSVTWANEYRVYQITGDNRELIYKGRARTYKVYNMTEDTHSFEVTAFSTRFGESAPSNRLTETIVYPVMQPPVATLILLSNTSARISWNFITYANGYNVYEIIDGKPVLLIHNLNNLSYTVSDLSYANHEYYVTSYSNSFGESEPSNIALAKLIVDTEPPVTKINAPIDWTNENPMVTLAATDNEMRVASTYYSLNDNDYIEGTSFTIIQEGIHKVSFYSVDKAGNREVTQTVYIKVDQTAPVTTANVPEGWSGENVTVNLSATDSLSNVAKTFYSIEDREYVEGNLLTIQEEGVHNINYYSVDKAGNGEEAKTSIVKIDKTAPEITMDLSEEYQLGTALQLSFAAKDDLSGIVSEKMIVMGPDFTSGREIANNSILTLDKPGVYNITITAKNAAGLTTTLKKQLVVYIPAMIEVTPKVIKGNSGIFTVRVILPEGYDTQAVDLNSASLNEVNALTNNKGYYNQAKLGQFKFERSDFTWTTSEVLLEFRGYVNGNLVIGHTTVKVQK